MGGWAWMGGGGGRQDLCAHGRVLLELLYEGSKVKEKQ